MKIADQAERTNITEQSDNNSLNLTSIAGAKDKFEYMRAMDNKPSSSVSLPELSLTDKFNQGGKSQFPLDGGKKEHLDGGKKDEFAGGKKDQLDGGKKDEFAGGKKGQLDGGKKDEFAGGKKDQLEGGKKGKVDPDEPDCIKPGPVQEGEKERFYKKEKEAEMMRLKKEKAAIGNTKDLLSDIECD